MGWSPSPLWPARPSIHLSTLPFLVFLTHQFFSLSVSVICNFAVRLSCSLCIVFRKPIRFFAATLHCPGQHSAPLPSHAHQRSHSHSHSRTPTENARTAGHLLRLLAWPSHASAEYLHAVFAAPTGIVIVRLPTSSCAETLHFLGFFLLNICRLCSPHPVRLFAPETYCILATLQRPTPTRKRCSFANPSSHLVSVQPQNTTEPPSNP